MSKLPMAVVVSNDEPDSSYGAERLAAAFGSLFETRLFDPRGGFGDPDEWLHQLGADALVLSGSDRSVLSELPWMVEEEAVLRAAVARGLPALAICFGHQLLAKALGAPIASRRKMIGLFEVETVANDPLFSGVPSPAVVPEQHSDHVTSLPEGFVLVATSDYCRVQAMRHARAPVYGLQFHPCYDDAVFDADEAWAALDIERPLRHDGGTILGNAVAVLAEAVR